MRYIGFLIIVAGLFITSCGTLSRTREPAKPAPDIPLPETTAKGQKIEEGVASWYGPKFHGKLTANGEQYDMHQLTAAHRTLPFNSLVKVKNLENGKSVVVRINDRGPFAKNRIIDLSRKAARRIGMIGPGTARVALILLGDTPTASLPKNLKVPTYTVQIGSFTDKTKAFEHSRHIRGSRVVKIQNPRRTFFRVYYGTFIDKNRAYQKKEELEQRGYRAFVKQVQNK